MTELHEKKISEIDFNDIIKNDLIEEDEIEYQLKYMLKQWAIAVIKEAIKHHSLNCDCKLPDKPPLERYSTSCHKLLGLNLSAHDCITIEVVFTQCFEITEEDLK